MDEVKRLGIEHADRVWRDRYGNIYEPRLTFTVEWSCGPLVRRQSSELTGPFTDLGPAELSLPWLT